MLDKTYQPAEIEPRIHAEWERAEAFKAGRPERKDAEPYCIVIPPPNVTGSLHMGHALNNTLQDVLCRFERMRGKDVLWQPGTDHAGIATQMVVERQMMERQEPDRRDDRAREVRREGLGVEGGVAARPSSTSSSASAPRCDWSRERFTMDEGLSKAVVKVFVDLYNAGLIYKDKRLVNWDPQVPDGDLRPRGRAGRGEGLVHLGPAGGGQTRCGRSGEAVRRRRARQGFQARSVRPHVSLPLSARAEGAGLRQGLHRRRHDAARDDAGRHRRRRAPRRRALRRAHQGEGEGEAAARRPPDPDRRRRVLRPGEGHGRGEDHARARLQRLRGRQAPRPRADQHARRARAAQRRRARGLSRARPLRGAQARSSPISRRWVCSEKIEPTTHTVPHGDRSGVVIEPYLTDQWYVDAEELAKPAIESGGGRQDRLRARRAGRRPTSSGCATSSPGASRASSGGATRSRRGTGPTAHDVRRPTTRPKAKALAKTSTTRRTSRAKARRGRARHLVLVRAVGVLDARLARQDARA